MNEKNVVLLGESHFAFKNGVTQGILDTGFKCFNLSLGGTPSLQNLYELIRNKKTFRKCGFNYYRIKYS
ncbi:hypothetical protein OLV29_07730 [Campylobacter jejuni]|nr:hypothetical protein [Campylobacter jejuni]